MTNAGFIRVVKETELDNVPVMHDIEGRAYQPSHIRVEWTKPVGMDWQIRAEVWGGILTWDGSPGLMNSGDIWVKGAPTMPEFVRKFIDENFPQESAADLKG